MTRDSAIALLNPTTVGKDPEEDDTTYLSKRRRYMQGLIRRKQSVEREVLRGATRNQPSSP